MEAAATAVEASAAAVEAAATAVAATTAAATTRKRGRGAKNQRQQNRTELTKSPHGTSSQGEFLFLLVQHPRF